MISTESATAALVGCRMDGYIDVYRKAFKSSIDSCNGMLRLDFGITLHGAIEDYCVFFG